MSQTRAANALVAELRSRIAEAADAERAPHMQAYMKSTMPFRGVGAVPLRRICTTVLAAHPLQDRTTWELAVRRLWDDAGYREERYAAIAVARHRHYRALQEAAVLDLYRHMVVTGAWWDLVDEIAIHLVGPILRSDPGRVTPVMRAWARNVDLWLRRTAILCQRAAGSATDPVLLADVLSQNLEGSLHGKKFFIRKAVGWALREYSRTNPGWVRDFVDQHAHEMSGLSRREALRNMPGLV